MFKLVPDVSKFSRLIVPSSFAIEEMLTDSWLLNTIEKKPITTIQLNNTVAFFFDGSKNIYQNTNPIIIANKLAREPVEITKNIEDANIANPNKTGKNFLLYLINVITNGKLNVITVAKSLGFRKNAVGILWSKNISFDFDIARCCPVNNSQNPIRLITTVIVNQR
jgi:hypothetical protein